MMKSITHVYRSIVASATFAMTIVSPPAHCARPSVEPNNWVEIARVLDEPRDVKTWRDKQGRSLVYYQLMFGSEDDALKSIEKLPYKPGWMEGDTRLLDLAINRTSQRMVKRLLEKGESPNGLKDQEWPPLHLAARNGEIAIMRMLLRAGADINKRTLWGTAAHVALDRGNVAALGMLLSSGVNLKSELADKTSANLMYQAVDNEHVDALQLLVSVGFDPNSMASDGDRLLHLAIKKGRIPMLVQELLRLGANPCLRDRAGETAIQLANRLYPRPEPTSSGLYEHLFWGPNGSPIKCP